ncbi:hypothetical protein HPU229254_09820 [Helicobacter pullorum]|nr:hypothetical protein HPU229254_09820 [Helicobacter pullorum]
MQNHTYTPSTFGNYGRKPAYGLKFDCGESFKISKAKYTTNTLPPKISIFFIIFPLIYFIMLRFYLF